MNRKKYIRLWILLIMLPITITLCGCGGSYMSPERALRDFSNRIEQGNLDNLTLIIYNRYSISTFHLPFNVEDFVRNSMYERKTVVDGIELKEHIELLRQINADNLIPVSYEYPMLVSLYYVFKANGRTIFGFVPQAGRGDSNSMFINGVEFEWDDAFFDVIRPFLPEGSPWLRDVL